MYEDKYNSKQLFLNTKSSLERAYQLLAQNNINSLSLEDFKNENQIAVNDLPFAEFLRQNFKNLDVNKNETISQQEINQLLNSIDKQGLTYEQLQTLAQQQGTPSGESKSLLSTVMENFNKIDINHDGRVSQEEINSYQFNKEVDDKKKEFCDIKASNFSIFYADDSSTTDSADTTVNTDKNKNTV